MTLLFSKLDSIYLDDIKHQKHREGFGVVLKKTAWDTTEIKNTQVSHFKKNQLIRCNSFFRQRKSHFWMHLKQKCAKTTQATVQNSLRLLRKQAAVVSHTTN